MLSTESNHVVGHRRSPRFVLLALLPVLVLLAALTPASAMAGSGGGGGDRCTAEVGSTQDETIANISVECPDDEIDSVDLALNRRNEGMVDGDSGTTCEPEDTSLNFTCQPSGSNNGSAISAQFTDDDGESVCAEPALEIDFTVSFADGSEDEEIDNVGVSGCSESSASGGDEDDGATPEGGVDSGAGGTAKPSAPVAAALPLTGAALIVLALASVGVVLRKTRTTP